MSSVTVRRRSRSALVNEPAEDASETKGTKRTIARGVVSEVVWYLVMQFYGFIVFLGFAMKAVTAKRSFRLMSSEEKRNYDSGTFPLPVPIIFFLLFHRGRTKKYHLYVDAPVDRDDEPRIRMSELI